MNKRNSIAAALVLLLGVLAWSVWPSGTSSEATRVTQAGAPAAATEPSSAPQPAAPPAPYAVASGVITQRNEAMGETVQEIYFDDFGRREAVYTTSTMEMMGQKFVTRTVKITDDGWITEFDADKKEGKRYRVVGLATGGSGGAKMPDIAGLSKEQMTEMQIEDLPPMTILGKEATGMSIVVAGMKMRAWTWEGIQMRSEVFLGEKPMVTEVTKLELGVPVPAERFQVPGDVKVVTQ